MKYYFIALIINLSIYSYAQETIIGKPIDFQLLLVSNFGELRPNHFHSGLDFKTQGVINKKIYSIADGYVSRIGVNAGGYGLVLYVDHPELGYTSVYGHLDSFRPDLKSFIKQKQYELESYTIDINLPDSIFLVKKGELLANSGNTGASGGPHLHFEIRELDTQKPIDALPFYKKYITDNEKPIVKGIATYQLDMDSNIILESKYYTSSFINKKVPINAWGFIGFGINTIDKMTGTSNIYGVKSIELYCDDQLISSYAISKIDFQTTRMINSLTDYDYWKKNKQFFVKSIIDPGNKLDMVNKRLTGWIDVNEERIYKMKYIVKDLYGNTTLFYFDIQGQEQSMDKKNNNILYYNRSNRYAEQGFSIYLPSNALTRNISFQTSNINSDKYYSDIYLLGNEYISLMEKAPISLTLKSDSIFHKSQYGIVSINEKDKESWIGGTYENGAIFANINELGNRIAVSIDSISPKITPINTINWSKNKKITIKLTDNLSGIKSFKGTIDGNFVLFQHDIKSSIYTYYFDLEKLSMGNHLLRFEATDRAGNISVYESKFTF